MTIEVKHKFTSLKADGPDTTRIRPTNWNDTHDFLMATNRILGRTTADAGAVEELTVGAGLTLAAGSLTANFGTMPADIAALQAVDVARRLQMPLADTNNSHDLLLTAGSDLTANRTLQFVTGDVNRVIDLTVPGASGGALLYLGVVNAAAAASIEFTGLSASYDEFIIELFDIFVSSGATVIVTVSTNNGSSYINSLYSYNTFAGATTNPSSNGVSGAASFIPLGATFSTNLGNAASGKVSLMTGTTDHFKLHSQMFRNTNNGLMLNAGGVALSGSRVNAVKIASGTGTITGKAILHGVKNS
jgi:hypothetical protein